MNSGDKHKIEENIPKINYKIPSYSDTEYVMKYINEGLITTYPYEKVIKSIFLILASPKTREIET